MCVATQWKSEDLTNYPESTQLPKFQTMNKIKENLMGQLMVIPNEDFVHHFENSKRYWNKCVRSQDESIKRD